MFQASQRVDQLQIEADKLTSRRADADQAETTGLAGAGMLCIDESAEDEAIYLLSSVGSVDLVDRSQRYLRENQQIQ